MEEIRVSIVTPEGLIFDEEVKSATLPGEAGEFGVQYAHSDLMSLLKSGVIEIVKKNNEKEYVAIDWGYAKVDGKSVDILANGAVALGEGSIAESLQKAKELLKSASSDEAMLSSALYKIDSIARR
ncbi:ATP synthase F1 subunit epsilon [uncultured Helicobacter sp.]|uniref:ATP synthase F1 subunit epsilon n=1 Tax=uncultured Helicobacter sp. TaxID=175537 RepID=UPI001F8E6066|nr:ATP synthase F1 subunit epsilon [uncultured Helicobacter sp.]HIY43830.1 F0F1 ATP synthase subunit epsilon [Candidatus Helicobacter avistercoris]